jgi:hypothetical protein
MILVRIMICIAVVSAVMIITLAFKGGRKP